MDTHNWKNPDQKILHTALFHLYKNLENENYSDRKQLDGYLGMREIGKRL